MKRVRILTSLAASAALSLAMLCAPARAEPVAAGPEDAAAIQGAVARHITAMIASDAKALYDLSSARARLAAARPADLLPQVEAPAWIFERAQSVVLDKPEMEGAAKATQVVLARGVGGQRWIASFAMAREAGGAWTVDAVAVEAVPMPGQPI